jgi:hypothetical protein
MRDRRKFERYVMQAPGLIVIQDAVHTCTIYDKSRSGLRLIKYGPLQLPSSFAIELDGNAQRQSCWLIWQADDEAGVSFEVPETKPPDCLT